MDTKFEYLKKRANLVCDRLEILSTDGSYTHDCNTHIAHIRGAESLVSWRPEEWFAKYEENIIEAEDYCVKIAQTFGGRDGRA